MEIVQKNVRFKYSNRFFYFCILIFGIIGLSALFSYIFFPHMLRVIGIEIGDGKSLFFDQFSFFRLVCFILFILASFAAVIGISVVSANILTEKNGFVTFADSYMKVNFSRKKYVIQYKDIKSISFYKYQSKMRFVFPNVCKAVVKAGKNISIFVSYKEAWSIRGTKENPSIYNVLQHTAKESGLKIIEYDGWKKQKDAEIPASKNKTTSSLIGEEIDIDAEAKRILERCKNG